MQTQLLAYLQDMTQLSHIRLDQKGDFEWRKYPSASLWSSAKTQADISHRYAQLIAVQCRSQQYIQIGFFAWQVMTPPHARPAAPLPLDADIKGDLMLRRLEDHEVLSVPIFSRHGANIQAGLSGRHYASFFHSNGVPDDVEPVETQSDMIDTVAGEIA